VGMMDPPRPEAKEAVKLCKKAGVRVVMITGDHKLTALAIAKELGVYKEGDVVLTGEELEQMSDRELEEIVEKVAVYARVSPEHKMKIVRALKKKGYVVAMTGDGVNDAPALKAADIGIAMGIMGTEVAKEASDMVLADDNFATIVEAVRQGREIFDNVKKYLAFLLQCNIAEIVLPLLASLSALPLPLTAVQYLWINLATDGLPALALGVDPADPDVMERPPRDPKRGVFERREALLFLVFVPALVALVLVALFAHALATEGYLGARTRVFTAMVFVELTIALSCRSLRHPSWKVGLLKNKFLVMALASSVVLQVAVLEIPLLREAFEVSSPTLLDWLIALAAAIAVYAAVETAKALFPPKG